MSQPIWLRRVQRVGVLLHLGDETASAARRTPSSTGCRTRGRWLWRWPSIAAAPLQCRRRRVILRTSRLIGLADVEGSALTTRRTQGLDATSLAPVIVSTALPLRGRFGQHPGDFRDRDIRASVSRSAGRQRLRSSARPAQRVSAVSMVVFPWLLGCPAGSVAAKRFGSGSRAPWRAARRRAGRRSGRSPRR